MKWTRELDYDGQEKQVNLLYSLNISMVLCKKVLSLLFDEYDILVPLDSSLKDASIC